jgi:hypothetical protein
MSSVSLTRNQGIPNLLSDHDNKGQIHPQMKQNEIVHGFLNSIPIQSVGPFGSVTSAPT